MKKILGLDIGTTSIGWAIIETADEKKINPITGKQAETDVNNDRIGIYEDAVGVRIISADEEHRRFEQGKPLNDPKGKTLTKTATRRKFRGARRMRSRYKLRRDKLLSALDFIGMKPDGAYFLKDNSDLGELYNKVKGKTGRNLGQELYKLRNNAIQNPISLKEWGRILLHLNQWRGYSSDRFKKEENEKFEYFTGTVTELSDKPLLIKYDDETESVEFVENADKTIRWKKYFIRIQLEEPIHISEGEKKEFVEGNVYAKDIKFKKGEFTTFKFNDYKKETKIEFVNPNPNDWKAKYKLLHNTLTEWCDAGGTVGSYFYLNYYEEASIERIRNNVVNRDWYEKEFDKIWAVQYSKHKETLELYSIDDILKSTFKDEQIHKDVKQKPSFEAQLKYLIKEKIIYYQRPWQQSKNKAKCRFEKIKVVKQRINIQTKQPEKYETYEGRAVVPRSHPLYQEYRIWQQINNFRIFELKGDKKEILVDYPDLLKKYHESNSIKYNTVSEIRNVIFDKLSNQKKITNPSSFAKEELGLNPELLACNYMKRKKDGTLKPVELTGNATLCSLRTVLKEYLKDKYSESWLYEIIKSTKDNHKGESANKYKTVSYQLRNIDLLWQCIYDITLRDDKAVQDVLNKHFPFFSDELIVALSQINFEEGMGNLSAKAIRKMLPIMKDGSYWDAALIPEKVRANIQEIISLNINESDQDAEDKLVSLKSIIPDRNTRRRLSVMESIQDFKGLNFWEAAGVVYGSHSSGKIGNTEISKLNIDKIIQQVPHNSMNNPVVEKIVNETLMLVRDIYKKYDGFDEVRIELSRELKASQEEREQMWDASLNNQKRIEWAKIVLREMKKDAEHSNSDLETTNKRNIDKLRIIEDVVKYRTGKEYEKKVKEFNLSEPTKAEINRYLIWLEQNFKCPYTDQLIPFTDVFSRYKVVEVEHVIPKERYLDDSYSNKVLTWRVINDAKQDNGNRTAYEFIVSKRTRDSFTVNGKQISLVDAACWEEHVKRMFAPGRKRNNLLRREIPDEPINRELKETQYINKKVKEELERIVGSGRVWTTTGKVTDILRESWHLHGVMKELIEDRYQNFKIYENKKERVEQLWFYPIDISTGEIKIDQKEYPSYSKRLDHRHHALDAIIIACTKQQHIQYINNLNTINSSDINDESEQKSKYLNLRKELCKGNSSRKFKTPWREEDFIPRVKESMSNIIVSKKNTNVLISPSRLKIKDFKKPQRSASIRGALHKETNYAKRNYYVEESHAPIEQVIEKILKRKFENQNQTMVLPKSFVDIIRQVVFKEKYQKLLAPIFLIYDLTPLSKTDIKNIKKEILEKISIDEQLSKIEWLAIYTEKNSSARPNGLSMDLNSKDEIKVIANSRIRRLAELRMRYIDEKRSQIEKSSLEKEEKDRRIKELKQIQLYSNAIYEVRVMVNNHHEWIYLPDLTEEQFNCISFQRNSRSKIVKELLEKRIAVKKEVGFLEVFSDVFENPIFINTKPIPVKKVRQLTWFQDLYEIHPKQYVYSLDTYMLYIFYNKESKERDWKFLKFIDAIKLIDSEKPLKIKTSELLKHEEKNFQLLFTLQKDDLIFLPDKSDDLEAIVEEDSFYRNISELTSKLYVVRDINPSLNKIVIQKHTIADAIQVKKDDAHQIIDGVNKDLVEEVKYGTADMLKRCIKLFSDKLGKTIVPYWKLPNGCWEKETAKRLGLIIEVNENPTL